MSDTQSLIGKTIAGRYIIREHLGQGGMGTVYLAQDVNLNRAVAVKLLSLDIANNPELMRRFDNEAKAIAKLEHPNIVDIYDYQASADDHPPFFAMRYLKGGTLKDRIKDSKHYSVEEAVDLLNKLASALDYCHAQGIVHRDIKPSNIMFDSNGNPYLVDFGIIKDLEGQGTTMATGLIGTAEYMSPEQILHAPISGATDQYSTAIMVYQMLTGRLPYEVGTSSGAGSSPGSKSGTGPKSDTEGSYSSHFEAHVRGKPLDITQMRRDMPGGLMVVLGKALEKNPEKRYPTMTAFAQAFDDAVHKRSKAGSTAKSAAKSAPTRASQQAKTGADSGGNNRMVLIGVVGLLALVLIALGVLFATGALDNSGAHMTDTAVAGIALQATDNHHATRTATVLTATAQAENDATATQDSIGATEAAIAQATQDAQATLDFIATETQDYFDLVASSTALSVQDNATGTAIAETAIAVATQNQLTLEARQTADVLTATQSIINATNTAVIQATLDVQATLDGVLTATADAAQMIASVQQARSTARVEQTLAANGASSNATPAQVAFAPTAPARTNTAFSDNPYGQSILFFSSDTGSTYDIFRINSDSTEREAVIVSDDVDEKQVAISPDGTQIAYVAGTNGAMELFIARIDGSDPRQLTDFGGEVSWPMWAPGGEKIAFSLLPAGESQHLIVTINADGSGREDLTLPGLDAQRPIYSPDGGRIAFYGGRDNLDLYVMRVEDLTPERLTEEEANDIHPGWSPDGESLVFVSDRDGLFRLYWLDLASGTAFPLPSGSADAFEPSFNRAGDAVIFCTESMLTVLDLTRQTVTPLTDSEAGASCPSGVGL